MIKRMILSLLLLAAASIAAQEQQKKPLLRDGFVLMGVDGKAVAHGDKWFFKLERSVSDGRAIVEAGSEIEMMSSAGLEKMVADIQEHPGRSYRLYNAMVTEFGGKNYLFCDYFLPLAEAKDAVSEKPAEPNKPTTDVMINEPNDAVTIPQEIIDKLKTRRIIRPETLKPGMELKQDSMLTERTGFIKERPDGEWYFEFDGVGRNVSKVTLELLPCQALARARYHENVAVSRARFKVSGIVTMYRGRYYLLLQTANRAYSYGNFGG